jgi:hypothetical protein
MVSSEWGLPLAIRYSPFAHLISASTIRDNARTLGCGGNKPGCGIVVGEAADVAFKKPT